MMRVWLRRSRRDGLPFSLAGWTVRGHLDVLGHPVMMVADRDGREVALDYSAATKREVPLAWARALGVEIDSVGVTYKRGASPPPRYPVPSYLALGTG